jgi:hypothetical protein
MADEQVFHGVCFAVGAQSARGTVNADIAGLTGTIDETHGCVLGRLDSGDAESGVTLPNHVRVGDEKALLANFTRQPTNFLRTDVEGLAIAISLQGNGATVTPALGECQPLNGTATDECVHALWLSAGLTGADGVAPVYEYTPAATPTYVTIKLFHGDHSFVYMDCLSSVTIDLTPGSVGAATFSFQVGSLNAQADGVTFPTVTYGTQTTLSAPVVKDYTAQTTHTLSEARGFNTYSLTLDNGLATYGDSNAADGQRVVFESRNVTLTSTIYLAEDTADSAWEYDKLVEAAFTSVADTTQVGLVAGATDTANAYLIEILENEIQSLKYNRIGTDTVAECVIEGRSDAAGGDFKLTFN